MLCGSLADMAGDSSSCHSTSATSSLSLPLSRSSPRRRISTPSHIVGLDSHGSSALAAQRCLPPRSAGHAPRSSHQAGGREVVILPLRRRNSGETPRLRDSRQANVSATLPSSAARAKRSRSVPRKAPRGGSTTGDETDAELALGSGHLDMLSSDFGYSSASLASRAPTFVSTHSAFTDESSWQTTDVASAASKSQLDLSDSYRAFRPPDSQPVPIRPPFARRRSSTGSLYDPSPSPGTTPSIAVVSSSVPSPRRMGPPTLAQSAPFSNLVAVDDVRNTVPRRQTPSRRPSFDKPALPPALHTTISITEGQPARKLHRKASLTARGKHGGAGPASPRADLPSPRPPLTAKSASAPAVIPRPSMSSRPYLTASRSFSSPTLPDILPIHLPPLPPPPPSAKRTRSKTKTASDVDASPQRSGSVTKSGTLRGSLVKLKKSTASLRSAFRSSRHDEVPSSPPPPLPPTPALPILTPRSAVAQTTSTDAFIAALEQAEKVQEATLKRRASSRAGFTGRSRADSVDGRSGVALEAFSYAATASSRASAGHPPPFAFPPSSPPPPSPSCTPRRSRSRPRPRTTSTLPHTHAHVRGSLTEDEEASPHSFTAAARLRRVASTGAVKPRRSAPLMPALIARLERHCAKGEAAAAAAV